MKAEFGELRKNIKAFHEAEAELKRDHWGQYALMSDGKVVHLFNSREDALMVGRATYSSGKFSVSPKIGAQPGSLGSAALYVTPVSVN